MTLRDQLDQIARLAFLERSLARKEALLKQCQKYVPNVLKERIKRELEGKS